MKPGDKVILKDRPLTGARGVVVAISPNQGIVSVRLTEKHGEWDDGEQVNVQPHQVEADPNA